MASNDERIARLVQRLSGMSEDEIASDPEFVALTDDERNGFSALARQKAAHHEERVEAHLEAADSFGWAGSTDYVDALDRGNVLLHGLAERASQPAGLLAMIDQLSLSEHRRDVVCGVFLAVAQQIWADERETPEAMRDLEREWYRRMREEE